MEYIGAMLILIMVAFMFFITLIFGLAALMSSICDVIKSIFKKISTYNK